MKVYAIEFKKDKSFVSNAIAWFTKENYTHTAGYFDHYFIELDAIDAYPKESDYHIYDTKMSIKDWLISNPESNRTEAYELPHDFTESEIQKLMDWWRKRMYSRKVYGYAKLLDMIFVVPLVRFYKRVFNKPYHPLFCKDQDGCSMALDQSIKYAGYDIFPDQDEACTWPGMYARKFKNNKIIV